jgi:molybdopterin synthase catalytic subunit
MGTPKGLLRDPDGTAWVARAVRALAGAGCDPVLVVVGADADRVAALVPAGARVVEATDWSEGMAASLRAGLAALTAGPAGTDGSGGSPDPADPESADSDPADPDPADAVLVSLVDTPGVTAEVVARLAAHGSPSVLARAGYGGAPGHPVLLGREHWATVTAVARGDGGARDYLRDRDVLLVECSDIGHGDDVDTADAASGAYADLVTRPDPLVAEHPALDRMPDPAHLHPTRAHDTTRLRPPARRVVVATVTEAPLDVAAHEAAVADASAGAVVSFSGVVRDHDGGRRVTGIEYVAHPSAGDVLARVVAEVATRTEVEAIAVSHRVGPLAVGESALVIAVAGAHRQEAFAAAALLVDEVKHHLPVWKRQEFADGTDEWVACP